MNPKNDSEKSIRTHSTNQITKEAMKPKFQFEADGQAYEPTATKDGRSDIREPIEPFIFKKAQLVTLQSSDLPLKQEQRAKKFKSQRAMIQSAKNIAEGRLSLLPQLSNERVADKTPRYSDLQSYFQISLKKTQISRSKSRGNKNPSELSEVLTVHGNAKKAEGQHVTNINGMISAQCIDRAFNNLIKKKSLSKSYNRSDRSTSKSKLLASKETECGSDKISYKGADDYHAVQASNEGVKTNLDTNQIVKKKGNALVRPHHKRTVSDKSVGLPKSKAKRP